MLKKLFKYDWKSVSLLLLILHGVLLAYSLIGRMGILFGMDTFKDVAIADSSTRIYAAAAGLYIILYVLFIFAITIATYGYLAIRFQKNLFSDQGYLTHTLPVSSTKLIWSKMFVAWAWIVIDFVCVLVSVALLLLNRETFPAFWREICSLFDTLSGNFGAKDQIFLVVFILSILVQVFGFYPILALFSMCLGNLFKTHKILGTILSFFGINMVLSILSAIIFLVIPAWSPIGSMSVTMADGSVITSTSPVTGQTGMFLFSLAWSLVFTLLFFLGSRYILTKKLNLD